MKYDELNIEAKVHCLNEWVNVVCAYDNFDDCNTVEELEYSIRETLKDSSINGFDVDEYGQWWSYGDRVR